MQISNEHRLKILQISALDLIGGAGRVAFNLHKAYRNIGHHATLAVGQRQSDDHHVVTINNDAHRDNWAKFWISVGNFLQHIIGNARGIWRIRNLFSYQIGQTRRWREVKAGHEDFDFPGTWRVLEIPSARPRILHCHNLHGNYFDLRALPWLSHQVPTVLTLHDAWLLSGHCAHSFNCERWKIGCGHCPDLSIPPAIPRDATAYNWQRKKEIYSKSRLYVATPSKWLMDKVVQSILVPGMVETRVIPYGVDFSIFHPKCMNEARSKLNIPRNNKVLLFTSDRIRTNPWKDYETMRASIASITELLPKKKFLFLALGEDAPDERIGKSKIKFIPYQSDSSSISIYYQAADVYIHAARADTFPNSVLEALSCGTPVVATAVGGIPEQVEHGKTGFLVPNGDSNTMAIRLTQILNDESLRNRFSQAAVEDSKSRFDLEREVKDYLNWHEEILINWMWLKPKL